MAVNAVFLLRTERPLIVGQHAQLDFMENPAAAPCLAPSRGGGPGSGRGFNRGCPSRRPWLELGLGPGRGGLPDGRSLNRRRPAGRRTPPGSILVGQRVRLGKHPVHVVNRTGAAAMGGSRQNSRHRQKNDAGDGKRPHGIPPRSTRFTRSRQKPRAFMLTALITGTKPGEGVVLKRGASIVQTTH